MPDMIIDTYPDYNLRQDALEDYLKELFYSDKSSIEIRVRELGDTKAKSTLAISFSQDGFS